MNASVYSFLFGFIFSATFAVAAETGDYRREIADHLNCKTGIVTTSIGYKDKIFHCDNITVNSEGNAFNFINVVRPEPEIAFVIQRAHKLDQVPTFFRLFANENLNSNTRLSYFVGSGTVLSVDRADGRVVKGDFRVQLQSQGCQSEGYLYKFTTSTYKEHGAISLENSGCDEFFVSKKDDTRRTGPIPLDPDRPYPVGGGTP